MTRYLEHRWAGAAAITLLLGVGLVAAWGATFHLEGMRQLVVAATLGAGAFRFLLVPVAKFLASCPTLAEVVE